MKEARDIVSLGLESRVSVGIKVRQPLSSALIFGKYSKEISKIKMLSIL